MIYLDNNTFQQEIFIPRSSVKNDASPEYATKNELENAIENEVIRADEKYAAKTDLLPYATTGWVESQDFATKEWTDEQIQSAITSETERTEETYQKKSEMGIYSTTNEVENMIDSAVSGKMDTSAMSAYTKTENFATINGSAITSGGNIVVEATPYTAGTNIDITDHIISVTGITLPTKVSELVNDEGYITTADTQNFVTSGDVQAQINDSISGKADSSAVTAQISEVKAQIEAEIPSKVSDLQNDLNFASTGDVESMISGFTTSADVKTQIEGYNYINSGQAQTQIDNAVSGKQDTLVSGENIKTINNQSLLGSGNIEIQGGGETYSAGEGIGIDADNIISVTGNYETIVELTQAEYDALTSYDKNTTYVITDAQAINMDNYVTTGALDSYYTSAQTDTAISNATSGKQDTLVSGTNIKTINNQSLLGSGNIEIQGGGEAYSAGEGIGIDADNIISVTGNYETIVELTQAEYDALTSYDKNTTYVITDAPAVNLSAYTPTSGFSTINGNVITDGGNIEIQGGNAYTAGANIDISTDNVISVTGITVPTSNTAFTNDAGYVTSGEVESQITGKNYATESWVQDNVNLAIESETARTESTYAKIGDIPSLDGYATTGWVESQGYLTEHQDISGKLDTNVFTTYTASTQTELNNKQDVSGMTAYYTSAQTDNIISNAVSGKLDTSAITAYSTTEEVENMITAATNGLASEEWVNNQGFLKEHQDISGKLDTSVFTTYTANTQTELNNKQDASGMTEYATTAFTESTYLKEHQSLSAYSTTEQVQTLINTAKQEVENEIPDVSNFVTSAQVETQITDKGYITGYTETDPVFMASAASGISAQDITNWNAKLDSSALTPYYTSAQTETQISNAVSRKVDSSRVDEIEEVTASALVELHSTKQDILISGTNIKTINNESLLGGGNIEIQGGGGSDYSAGANIDITNNVISVTGITVPTSTSALTNDSGYVTSGEVNTQIESKGYITDAALNGYATTAFTEQTYLKEHQSLSAYTPTSGFSTINGNVITDGGNLVIEETPYTAGANIDITDHVISVTGITVPTSNTAFTNDAGYVNSGEVETQIESKGYITAYTESDPVFQASAASGITSQNITNWNNKLDSSALTPYYTSAQTNTAISNAVSGKTDKVSVTASGSGYKFPKWNGQGCITGTSATAYQAFHNINGSSRKVYSDSSEALPTIYAPTSEGLAGQPLLSNGSGAPVWGAYKFQFISQSQYDALATKDSTTIYFIVNEN